MVTGVADRASAEEQASLEERVGKEVEHSGRVRTHPKGENHITELRHRRVRQHLFDVALHKG